jgi:hypothetical protein
MGREGASARYRLGGGVGGTYTDAIRWGELGGAARVLKVSSTPGDPSW